MAIGVKGAVLGAMDAMVTRQFACGKCRKKWWKEVSAMNPTCECYTCSSVLAAIPRDKEYGVGLHECECGHVFHGRTRAGVTSPCYKCDQNCLPKIIPNKAGVSKKSDNVHECATCGGRGDCVHFHEIIHTSKVVVVGHVDVDDGDGDGDDDDGDWDDYYEGDDDEDGYDGYDDYGEYGHYSDEDYEYGHHTDEYEGLSEEEEDPLDYCFY